MVSEIQRAQSPSSHFLPPTPLATVYALKTSANYPDTFIRVVILLVNSFFVNFNCWALPMKLFSYSVILPTLVYSFYITFVSGWILIQWIHRLNVDGVLTDEKEDISAHELVSNFQITVKLLGYTTVCVLFLLVHCSFIWVGIVYIFFRPFSYFFTNSIKSLLLNIHFREVLQKWCKLQIIAI